MVWRQRLFGGALRYIEDYWSDILLIDVLPSCAIKPAGNKMRDPKVYTIVRADFIHKTDRMSAWKKSLLPFETGAGSLFEVNRVVSPSEMKRIVSVDSRKIEKVDTFDQPERR